MKAPGNHPPTDGVPDDWVSRSHVQTLVLTGLTVFGIYLCYRLAAPFLSAITWALALSVLFSPVQGWLEGRLRSPSIAALVAVIGIALMVAVPATFVAQRLVVQAAKGAELVETRVKSGEWQRSLRAQPQLAPLVDQVERRVDLPGAMAAVSGWLSNTGGVIFRGSVLQAVEFGLTFYLLFFFLRDRHQALVALRSTSPLQAPEMDRLLGHVGDTIYATLYGTLAVSVVQGVLGGLMFWWLGLPAPLLWGLIMALLAVVPVLGAFVIWIPAALFLALEGNWGKALILILWGMVVVGTADNLLRPILVGNRLRLHTVLAFISLVGGLMVFGASGLVLGPVVLTITTGLLEIWTRRIRAEGRKNPLADVGEDPETPEDSTSSESTLRRRESLTRKGRR